MIINFSQIQAKGQKVGEIQAKLYWILKLNCHDIQTANVLNGYYKSSSQCVKTAKYKDPAHLHTDHIRHVEDACGFMGQGHDSASSCTSEYPLDSPVSVIYNAAQYYVLNLGTAL